MKNGDKSSSGSDSDCGDDVSETSSTSDNDKLDSFFLSEKDCYLWEQFVPKRVLPIK